MPAASADDARPILTGVLMAAEAERPAPGGHRLLPAGGARPARHDACSREGQSVLVPSRALRELERLLGGADEVTLRLGERDATFEVGGVRLTTRLIEGEFPNYRGLIPAQLPQPAHRRPRAAARRGAPGEAAGPGGDAGAARA